MDDQKGYTKYDDSIFNEKIKDTNALGYASGYIIKDKKCRYYINNTFEWKKY